MGADSWGVKSGLNHHYYLAKYSNKFIAINEKYNREIQRQVIYISDDRS